MRKLEKIFLGERVGFMPICADRPLANLSATKLSLLRIEARLKELGLKSPLAKIEITIESLTFPPSLIEEIDLERLVRAEEERLFTDSHAHY